MSLQIESFNHSFEKKENNKKKQNFGGSTQQYAAFKKKQNFGLNSKICGFQELTELRGLNSTMCSFQEKTELRAQLKNMQLSVLLYASSSSFSLLSLPVLVIRDVASRVLAVLPRRLKVASVALSLTSKASFRSGGH